MRLSAAGVLRRLGDQRGFAMPAALGALIIVMALSAAAIAAAGGDTNLSRYDQDDKQAYAAAEAGVNDFLARLNRDSNSWASCDDVPTPVSQPMVARDGTQITTNGARRWLNIPGSTSSRYSIELIPTDYSTRPAASGPPRCDPADPIGSMIYQGNLRIRATGNVNGTDNYRSITTTFRRTGFLDFIYFTDLENQDLAYSQRWSLGTVQTRATTTNGTPITGEPDLLTWAADKCDRHAWGTQSEARSGRKEYPQWRGQYLSGGTWTPAGSSLTTTTNGGVLCGEIQFADQDKVNGPFHTNDDFRLCGSPDFGRPARDDRVQTAGDGWTGSCSSPTPAPDFFPAPLRTRASQLDPPPSNVSLDQVVLPAYRFTGQTSIALNGANMTVTSGGQTRTLPLPPNGVVYVANGSCTAPYNPADSERQYAGCGDVRLSGTYSRDLTISAANDIVVTANVTRVQTSSALLGLIPQGFLRIWHPVTDQDSSTCANTSQSPSNIRIDAAILTLTGSFTVDNYWCGAQLGTLTVNGAIAQKHRGVVGQGNNEHGYIKDYNYDDRLKSRSPPYFLDPVQSAWRILRQSEQSPPARP